MPTGPGSLDAQGIWQYGEADTESLASDLLNLGQASVTTQFAADRARLDSLESVTDGLADTGWQDITLTGGATVSGGLTPQYRVLNGVVHLRGRLRTGGVSGAYFTLPAGARPGQEANYSVRDGTTDLVCSVRITTAGEANFAGNRDPNLDAITFTADN